MSSYGIELEEEIGKVSRIFWSFNYFQGAFSTVYAGRISNGERKIAVKVIDMTSASKSGRLRLRGIGAQ
jgi:hypothetical protein